MDGWIHCVCPGIGENEMSGYFLSYTWSVLPRYVFNPGKECVCSVQMY